MALLDGGSSDFWPPRVRTAWGLASALRPPFAAAVVVTAAAATAAAAAWPLVPLQEEDKGASVSPYLRHVAFNVLHKNVFLKSYGWERRINACEYMQLLASQAFSGVFPTVAIERRRKIKWI